MSILTPQEYSLGKIPDLSDFDKALNLIQSFYKDNSNRISSLLIYGSVSNGNHTLSSDIDCLLVTKEDSTNSEFSKILRELSQRSFIEVEVNLFREQDLERGIYHNLNPSFTQHLKIASRDGIQYGENPFSLLPDFSLEEIKDSAKESLEYRMSKLLK
jgi:predicted nucleotidyltransferase